MHMHGFLIWKVVHVYLGVAHHQSDNSCVFCVPLNVFFKNFYSEESSASVNCVNEVRH